MRACCPGLNRQTDVSVALEQSCGQFLDYLRDVRQLSPHTLSNYQRDLASLSAWAEKNKRHSADELNEADIRSWVSQLHRRGLAGSSIQRSLSAARSLFNYLGRENGYPRNPAASVQAPRKPRKLPKTLDADQVDRYLDFEDDNPTARRDRAIAELFYSSGLRLAELTAVNIDDIDRDSQMGQVYELNPVLASFAPGLIVFAIGFRMLRRL